ncbi:MAG: HEAT repeat domain-containing protein, partial [Sphaerospermopsis kisseleviana]
MYDEDDINLLDNEADLESPLDKIEPITPESEIVKPDPEAMLAL